MNPISNDEIYSGGGSINTGFAPIPNAYGYTISGNTYETEPNLPYNSMAVYGGVNYMSPENSGAEILRVTIAGGITTGPQLTNQCWVFIDTMTIQGISDETGTIPDEYSLMQNYPNPFNPSTTIRFSLPENSFTVLKIFNSLGEKVATLVSENLTAGTYRFNWDASEFTSGIYFYNIQAGDFTETMKMILLK